MKNLKKVLALVLVVASVLSFATVASAASFTDKDSITNTEAVNMLADLGVINGFTDGSYRPTETVTRAQMAKMIYAVCTGDDDASGFVGTTTALKDINQAPWAEGYIKYCYSLGIIGGFPDNTFRPNEPVTVAQAAKMLLVALGYDSNEYVGASWSINTMRDAKAAKITKDVSTSAALAASRDVSAQLIYNTMFADQVIPEYQYDMGVKYVTGYKKAGTTLAEDSFDMVKISGMVTNVGKESVTIKPENAAQQTVKLAGTYDMLGKTGTVYMKDDNGKKVLYSTSVSVDDDIVLYSTTNGDSFYKSAVDSSKKQVTLQAATTENTTPITVLVNGDIKKIAPSAIKDTDSDKNGAIEGLVNGKGTEVLYIDGDKDGNVDTIKVTNYTPAKVSAYSTINKTMQLTAQTGGSAINAEVSGEYKFENVPNYESFAKNDIVYAVKFGDIIDIYPTTKVEGKVSGKVASSSSIRVDGTTYAFNTNSNKGFGDIEVGNEGKYYLDANGYVIFADTDAKVSLDKYAYVKKAAPAVSYDDTQKATLVFTDGTEAVVDVAKYQANGAESATDVTDSNKVEKDTVVTYSVSDGKYTLKYSDVTATKVTNKEIKKGTPQSDLVSDGKSVTTASTIFVDTENKAVYTGYASVPSQEQATCFVKSSSGKVELVFLTSAKETGNDVKFFIYKTNAYESYEDKDGNEVRTYDAIVNGELTTIDVKGEAAAKIVDKKIGLYVGTADSKGVIDEIDLTKSAVDSTAMPSEIAGDKSTVLVWKNTAYVLNDNTVYYQIKDGKATLVDSNYLDLTDIEGVYVQNVGTSSDADKITAKVVYILRDAPYTAE